MGIEIKFYNLDTFKKQVDANCIDLNSEFVDLNYKVASLIFCHFWRSIKSRAEIGSLGSFPIPRSLLPGISLRPFTSCKFLMTTIPLFHDF